jgi:Flp pilus assembly protein TadG
MTNPRSERGAAAVEFALVVPLLLLLVVGIAEFGRAYNISATLASAARTGARTMALENNAGAARTATQGAATGLGLSTSQISISPSTCPSPSTGSTTLVTVSVTYPMTFVSGLLGSSITLKGTGVMRCNG